MLTVIFGAGASYNAVATDVARDPRADLRMPLAKELFARRDPFDVALRNFPQCQPLVLDLRRELLSNDPRSLEELLERIQDDAATHSYLHEQLAALRLYLRWIIWSCEEETLLQSSGLTNYVNLLQRIRFWQHSVGERRVSLVTFNYDRLLEAACRVVFGLQTDQVADYVSKESVGVYKLHGSIDWVRLAKEPPTEERLDLNGFVRSAAETEWSDDIELESNRHAVTRNSRFAMPALSIPTLTKRRFECPEGHLTCLAEDLGRTDRVLVIGWRGLEPHFYDDITRGNLKLPLRIHVVAEDFDAAQTAAVNIANGTGVPLNRFEARSEDFGGYMRDASALAHLLETAVN